MLVAGAEGTEYADRAAAEEQPAPASRIARLSRATFVGGITLTVALFAIGGWNRRWIADDGLIVLRTVRNLLAGNGPVFNAGERVEANTSTAWTYIVWFFSWLTQVRLEYVVLGVALTLSLIAIVFAMLGSARLWGGTGSALLLPAGAIVYISLPAAREYVTSGRDTRLAICWLAVLWWSMMGWAQAERGRPGGLAWLVFLAGLAPLIRPEMTLVGALALLMIFFAPMPRWRFGPVATRAMIVAVAGVVPMAYQIWRMGYYGLPYPNTAVAKDAGGAKWEQGFTYLWDLVGPYLLWLPLLVLLVAAVAAIRGGGLPAWTPAPHEYEGDSRLDRVRRWLRSPAAVVTLVLVSGFILTVYALRVGGDFMHGRMLLAQLFLFLLPVSVLPLRLPRSGAAAARRGFGVVLLAWLATMIWALFAAGTTAITSG